MDSECVASELLKLAKGLVAIEMPNSGEMRKFIKYFESFYGDGKIYPIEGLKKADIIKGVKIRIQKYPDMYFEGDSADRELVRDIVLGWRKMSRESSERNSCTELVRVAKGLVGSISGKVQPLYFTTYSSGSPVRIYWVETLPHFELSWGEIIGLPKHIKKVSATMNLRATKAIREFQFSGNDVDITVLDSTGHTTYGGNRMQIVGDGGIDVITDDIDAFASHLESRGFEEA